VRLRRPDRSFLRLLPPLLSGLSALAAAVALLEPPSWPGVVLKILATEWGHLLALPAAAVALLPIRRRDPWARAGGALGLVAALLPLATLARAHRLARELPARLAAAFGEAAPRSLPGAPSRPAPLVLIDTLRGVRLPPPHKRRIAYVKRGERELALDFYPPAGGGPAPCLVVIHGGSWQSGDSTQLPELNVYLAARGYAVAALNYRLLPDHPFPAARDDVLAALEYLKASAAELGIDPNRIVLLGRSAGGQLALLVAYTAADPAIRGVISFYAPIDLAYGYYRPAPKRVIDTIAVIESYLGGSPTSAAATYTAAAPISHVGAGCPPTLLIHGGHDNLVAPEQSERLARRLAAAGCPHMYLYLPWATHGGDVNFSGPTGQICAYAIERFLAAVTG
jgi:acetyl esterase/lipase